jgi:heptosyltransferase II
MSRILVVAPSWIGDTVLAQSLFIRLHQRSSDLMLDVLAPAWSAGLLHRMEQVNEVFTTSFGHGELRLGERWRLARQIRGRNYDRAIVLPNSFKSALVPWLARIPLRTGYVGEARYGLLNDARRLDETALPALVDRFVQLGQPPGEAMSGKPPRPALKTDDASRRRTLALLGLSDARPAAAFCPGAEYGPAKRWPARHFAELARLLVAQGYQIWLLGSAKDQEAAAEIQRISGDACRDLCGSTDLSAVIDVLASATVVVSNDSGLMHIAAALDRPLAALYGSSSPAYTPPLSDKATVISLALPCSPCFQRQCPLGHFNCMQQMLPARVAEELSLPQR